MAVTFVPSPYLVAQVKVDPGIGAALEMIADAYVAISKDLVPVSPSNPEGHLRDAIYHEPISGNGQRIIADKDYWNFPEFGTSQMDPTPYLRPPLEELGLHQ